MENKQDVSNQEIEEIKKEIKKDLIKNQILGNLENDEIDLFEIFKLLLKRSKLILGLTFFGAVASILYALLTPNYFKAQAKIFVHSAGKSPLLSGALGVLSSFVNLGPMPGSGETDYLFSYLKSDTLVLEVMRKLNLATNTLLFGEKLDELKQDDLLKTMSEQITNISKTKEGLIEVSVETKSATLSAEISKCYVDVLQKMVKGPQKMKRIFIEEQLAKTSKELAEAEEKLKTFQSQNKIVSVDEQTKAFIQNFAKLESEQIATEIQTQMQESLLKVLGNLPELVKLKGEKVAIEGKNIAIKKAISDMEKELDKLPELALEYARLFRDVTIKGKIFAVLTEQFEATKITEAEEGSSFEVIDQPRIPDRKSKPARTLIVIVATLSSFFLGIFLAFIYEYWEKNKKEEISQRRGHN